MDLIRYKKKIRALDLLERIQSFEVNTKLTELQHHVDQEKNDAARYSAIKNSIASFDRYEETSLANQNSEARHAFSQQYIDILLTNEASQKTVVSNNEHLTSEFTKDIQHSYNLNRNISKKLKSERINFIQAVNHYDAQL